VRRADTFQLRASLHVTLLSLLDDAFAIYVRHVFAYYEMSSPLCAIILRTAPVTLSPRFFFFFHHPYHFAIAITSSAARQNIIIFLPMI